MPLPADLDRLDAETLRRLLIEQERELVWRQTKIERLTHELALHKRHRFGVRAERLSAEQAQLFEETAEADLAAMSEELEQLQADTGKPQMPKGQARRKPLPPELPRTEIRHEPDSTTCVCGCQMRRIGEDVAEKLDYTPGHFTVERHIRGKWACSACETLVQAPVPAHIIDKGIPTAGLLAQVLVAKYQDHLPLYRQEGIFGRAGLAIPQSTLAQWVGQSGVHLQPLVDELKAELLAHPVLHADETPVAMLDPGAGKTHRAYLWSYSVGAFDPMKAVVYDFADSRAGRHAQAFLGDWRGTLICDDYAGYKALIAQGVREAGCMAHARRKFFDLTTQGQSQIASEALDAIGELYGIEREAVDLDIDARQSLRDVKARPILERLHAWLLARRTQVPNGSGIARAIDYSLKRWVSVRPAPSSRAD
ncbi:MAG: IS66 family transposase [Rhodocyclaceae bacterium]|nr:IS66 family transposase [Rhodocyclaceae bacterium]